MATDLTGGLDPAREYVLTAPPQTPGMRDAVNMWLWDDEGIFGLPRFAVEALKEERETPEIHLSVGLSGTRMLRNWAKAPAHPVAGADGKPSHFGAGPLGFDCIEPFKRYRAVYDGEATSGSFDDMVAGTAHEKATLKFEFDCEAAVPPWVQGTMSRDADAMMNADTVESAFMGGDRLEQLCRASGRITVDGVERSFKGGALRIRRQGVRQISGFWGHCWQSALFPSGRAFGYIAYPPRPDGVPSYNEGYVFSGDGALIPARVTQAPWLNRLQHNGEDVSCVIESDIGTFNIAARTAFSMPTLPPANLGFPPLLQSIVRYEWDGEVAYGMMERSNLPERVTNLPK